MQNFACPSCGGSIAYAGTAPTVVCNYCGNTVAVPEALRQPGLTIANQQLASRSMRWVIVFIILVFGVPTCLGLVGAAVGVIAPIFAMLVTLFVHR